MYQFNKAATVGESNKLASIWEGSWVVVEVLSDVLYQIQGRKLVTHPYTENPTPGTNEVNSNICGIILSFVVNTINTGSPRCML